MKRKGLSEDGRGPIGSLFWIALIALIGWLGLQLYQHPESFNPKAAAHHAYEDTQPQDQR